MRHQAPVNIKSLDKDKGYVKLNAKEERMNKKGFTLIELVMVIVIIGILAAVAVPRFVSLRRDALRATCQSDVGAIRSALTTWYAQFNLNNSCPYANTCNNTSGYPLVAQLSNSTSSFGANYFAEGRLPKTTDITNTSGGTWGDYYDDGTGVLNIDTACTP